MCLSHDRLEYLTHMSMTSSLLTIWLIWHRNDSCHVMKESRCTQSYVTICMNMWHDSHVYDIIIAHNLTHFTSRRLMSHHERVTSHTIIRADMWIDVWRDSHLSDIMMLTTWLILHLNDSCDMMKESPPTQSYSHTIICDVMDRCVTWLTCLWHHHAHSLTHFTSKWLMWHNIMNEWHNIMWHNIMNEWHNIMWHNIMNEWHNIMWHNIMNDITWHNIMNDIMNESPPSLCHT